MRQLLTDGRRTSVRLVVNPERMVIAEARRTHTYLSLFGYHVDAVVANRLLPDEVSDPWFARWKAAHAEHLAAIDEGFAPVPVLRVPLQPTEQVGLAALRSFADALYGDEDPTARFGGGEPMRVRRRGRHGARDRPAVLRPRRARARPGRRRAAGARRSLPPGGRAARRAAPAVVDGRRAARRPPLGDLRRPAGPAPFDRRHAARPSAPPRHGRTSLPEPVP